MAQLTIHPIAQTKCLPGEYAIHVEHGWCLVIDANGMQRSCITELGPDSYEFDTDVRHLKIVDPHRDLMPKSSAKVLVLAS